MLCILDCVSVHKFHFLYHFLIFPVSHGDLGVGVVYRRVEQLQMEVSSLDRAYHRHNERQAELVRLPGLWAWLVK